MPDEYEGESACRFTCRRCAPRLLRRMIRSRNAGGIGLDSAPRTHATAPARDRNRRGSAHAFSAPARGPAGVRRISARRKRDADLSLRRSHEDPAAPFRWLEENFRSDLEESEANALSQPLVLRWFNLHYVQKMIATGQRLVVFGKPRLRGQAHLHGASGVRGHRERRRNLDPLPPDHADLSGDRRISQRVFRGLIYRAGESGRRFSRTLLPRIEDGARRHALQRFIFRRAWKSLARARDIWSSRNSSPCRW